MTANSKTLTLTNFKKIRISKMFKIKTLSLIFLLMFKTLNLEALEAQEGSFEEDTTRCVNSLTKTDLPIQADLPTQAETNQTDLRHGTSDHPIDTTPQSNFLRNLWNSLPFDRSTLRALSNKTGIINISEIHLIETISRLIKRAEQIGTDMNHRVRKTNHLSDTFFPIRTFMNPSTTEKEATNKNTPELEGAKFEHKELLQKLITKVLQSEQTRNYFTENERQMREQGYSDDYIAGLDHVNESLRLARFLRTRRIFL